MVTTSIRSIGDSKGIILHKQILEKSGITGDVMITARHGAIIIVAAQPLRVNKDLKTWGTQFKRAFSDGHAPEKSIWGDVSANSDKVTLDNPKPKKR